MEREPREPRVDVSHMENISNVNRLNVFTYRTDHSLKDALSAGYFRNMKGLEPFDRIVITASTDGEQPEHATLVVTAATPSGGVAVEVLHGPDKD